MTEEGFRKTCEQHGIIPPPGFYDKFVIHLEKRRSLDFTFFEMLRKFIHFEDRNSFTVCKMLRFVREISQNKDLASQADWACLLGQLIGKRMQAKLEENRDVKLSFKDRLDRGASQTLLKLREWVDAIEPQDFAPGEN